MEFGEVFIKSICPAAKPAVYEWKEERRSGGNWKGRG